jgi:hypothetical protein
LPIVASTMTNACGVGTGEVLRALQAGRSGLRLNDFAPAATLATWIGRVGAVDASSCRRLSPPTIAGTTRWRNSRSSRMASWPQHAAPRSAMAPIESVFSSARRPEASLRRSLRIAR